MESRGALRLWQADGYARRGNHLHGRRKHPFLWVILYRSLASVGCSGSERRRRRVSAHLTILRPPHWQPRLVLKCRESLDIRHKFSLLQSF